MTFFTFVCTKCSGVHRELQFKIKGISMSTFTQDDAAALEGGGNLNFNAEYMARYNASRDMQIPTGSTDVTKLRDFIRLKYTDLKWHSEDGRAGGEQGFVRAGNSSYSDSVPGSVSSIASRRASVGDLSRPTATAGKVFLLPLAFNWGFQYKNTLLNDDLYCN